MDCALQYRSIAKEIYIAKINTYCKAQSIFLCVYILNFIYIYICKSKYLEYLADPKFNNSGFSVGFGLQPKLCVQQPVVWGAWCCTLLSRLHL